MRPEELAARVALEQGRSHEEALRQIERKLKASSTAEVLAKIDRMEEAIRELEEKLEHLRQEDPK